MVFAEQGKVTNRLGKERAYHGKGNVFHLRQGDRLGLHGSQMVSELSDMVMLHTWRTRKKTVPQVQEGYSEVIYWAAGTVKRSTKERMPNGTGIG